MYKKYPFILLFLCATQIGSSQAVSSIAYIGESGCMEYVADEENNHILDFSYAGYKGGGVPLPEVATILTIAPLEGDNTTIIQTAIDSIAKLPLTEEGLRGAIQLIAGNYEIQGQIFINESGIVLRGVGDGLDSTNSTILRGIGNIPEKRDLIVAGNPMIWDWKKRVPNSTVHITNPFLPAGSRSVTLASTENFTIGDNIIVYHPSTDAWLASINYGDTADDEPWKVGDLDMYYQRQIVDIVAAEDKIILSAPIYDHLDNSLAQSEVYRLEDSGIKTNIGVEDLRIIIETASEEDENHVKNGIVMKGMQDGWVQGVTVQHFIYAAVYTRAASNITIRNCQGLLPHSQVLGARRYNFDSDAFSNNILFEKCHASNGRHSFVSNGASSAAGIVFHDCTTEQDYNASEGHRRWSQGLLFDKITFINPRTRNLVGLYNRGDYGTGHGWSSVHSVAWNVNLGSSQNRILIQKPPGRQNYAVGCLALLTNVHAFNHPFGKVDLARKTVTPNSLYQAQLADRLANGSKPDAPAKLTYIFDENQQQSQLNWLDIAADETGYLLQISVDGGETFKEFAQTEKNATSYNYTLSDTLGGELIFRIAALNDACKSAFSNPVSIEVLVSNKEIAIPNVSIYPNPATELLFIEGEITIEKISIFNIAGQPLIAPSITSNTINIDSLTAGVYFLKIIDKQARLGVYKFTKI